MPPRTKNALPAPIRLLLILVLVICVGTSVLMLPGMSPGAPLAWNEALFLAVSALCVTGLSTINPASELTLMGKGALTVLIQLGGIGYIVIAVVVFQFLGRAVRLTERIELEDELGMVSAGGVAQLAKRVLFLVLGCELVGATILFLAWRELAPPGVVAAYAFMTSVIAFCHTGFDLLSGSAFFPSGLPTDVVTRSGLVLTVLAGGMGLPVLFEIGRTLAWRRWSLHTRLTVVGTAALVVGGGLLLWIGEPAGALHQGPLPEQIVLTIAQAACSRTAGFAFFDLTTTTATTHLTLVMLMFIGAGAASTGGGIGVTTFLVLLLGVAAYARRREQIVIWGRTLGDETFRRAGAITTVSLITVTMGAWLLSLTHDVPLDVTFFESVSAFTTTGLTLGFTPSLNLFGQMLVCLLMVAGRLGPLTLIFLLSRREDRGSPVRYPEEKVLL